MWVDTGFTSIAGENPLPEEVRQRPQKIQECFNLVRNCMRSPNQSREETEAAIRDLLREVHLDVKYAMNQQNPDETEKVIDRLQDQIDMPLRTEAVNRMVELRLGS